MNLSFKMLKKTCDASLLSRGGTELEIGRKLPTGKAVPTTYQDHVRTTEQGERRKRREGRRGKSRVALLWPINAQGSGGPGKLGNASPHSPQIPAAAEAVTCSGTAEGARDKPQEPRAAFGSPRAASSHPLGQKRM